MSEETTPEFVDATVLVKSDKGELQVPALTHPHAAGLAVTMSGFGLFEVTHVSTGLRLAGRYERMGNALLTMSMFAKIASTFEFNWDELSQAQSIEKLKSLGAEPVPFEGCTTTSNGETKPMQICDWLAHRGLGTFDSFGGEFPWEESDPANEAAELLATCQSVNLSLIRTTNGEKYGNLYSRKLLARHLWNNSKYARIGGRNIPKKKSGNCWSKSFHDFNWCRFCGLGGLPSVLINKICRQRGKQNGTRANK